MDSYIETFEKAIKNHKNGIEDKSVPAPFLVHRSGFQPTRTEDGYAVGSTFYEQGGLDQKNIDLVEDYHNAMNVHFAVQGSVVDHYSGKWTDKKWSVYAPYIPALEENGVPETCLTADTAFVSTDEPVHLPGAILIENVPAQHLGSDFTGMAPDGHILMADSITSENRNSALAHIGYMREAFGNSKALISVEDYIHSGKSDENYANMNTIRDIVGANKMASVPDFYFHEKNIGGFLALDETDRLAAIVSREFPDPSGFVTGTTLHNATVGHTLRHPEYLNRSELEYIAHNNKNHPKLCDISEKISTSDFHRELRSKAILETMRRNDMHIPLQGEVSNAGNIHF